MVKKELSETEIAESIPDLWQPLTDAQKELILVYSLNSVSVRSLSI